MKKEKTSPANRREGIANGQTAESQRGAIRMLLMLEDNTIEDTSRIELDQMLTEYGYNR